MGVTPGLFSSSSFDNKSQSLIGMPNPENYKIIKSAQIIDNLVIMIRYLDCTNYEGKKILVFKNCTREKLEKQKIIDPHFSENKEYHSPHARFEPTPRGWLNAKMTAQYINSTKNIKV